MENKVIINLDEYLELKEKVNKIDALISKGLVTIEERKPTVYTAPNCFSRDACIREISISKADLNIFMNDIFGLKDYKVNIVEE